MSQAAATWGGQELKCVRIPLVPVTDESRYSINHILLSHEHIIATIGEKIFVYTLLDLRLIHSLQCQSPITSFDVYQTALVTRSEDYIIRIWDLISGECLQELTEDAEFLSIVKPELVEVEENGTFIKEKWPKNLLILTSPSNSLNIKVWRVPSLGEVAYKADGDNSSENPYLLENMNIVHDKHTWCLAARSRTAVTGGHDSTVRIWDIITGECKWVLIGHTDIVRSVDIDLSQAYSGSWDNTVRIWDIKTGECCRILKSHRNWIMKVRRSHSYLLSFDLSGILCIWDPVSGKLNHQISGLSRYQHDDRKIFLERKGPPNLELWDIRRNRLLKDFFLGDVNIADLGLWGRFFEDEDRFWIDVWEFPDEDGLVGEEAGPK